MKKLLIILLPLVVIIYPISGCDDDEIDYFSGEIVEFTCGGTVIKFLGNEKVGEDWDNYFSSPVKSYTNCVLAGNISEDHVKGDTIYFSFVKVEHFTNGNFCDIGGLPNTKIEITTFK